MKYVLFSWRGCYWLIFRTWQVPRSALVFHQGLLSECEYKFLTSKAAISLLLSNNGDYTDIVPYSASYTYANDRHKASKALQESQGIVLSNLVQVDRDIYKGERIHGRTNISGI